jgi:phospholipase
MKHSLFILFLAASPFIFAQEAINDSLQELPKAEQRAHRKAQLERTLSKMWELDREDQRGTFKLVEYLPMYIMPFRYTDVPTEQPISLNPDRPIPEWRDYQHVETKFQVSLKAKIMQDAFGKGDVWVAFTQQSYWQMYNGELSRPFRELNYEPELHLYLSAKLLSR